jgi:UDPglucose--hexose-1-phosphate uridylyltransferase
VNELRWHPLLREWVVVAAHRQDRPHLPQDGCPFCPGSGRVPEQYDVHLYPNDFAAFQPDNEPFVESDGLYRTTGARGSCDVVLYHSQHDLTPAELSVEHWRKVVDLWIKRDRELAGRPDTACVFIFENTGVAIGVTMPHPHGQIYALPFVPPLVSRELETASEHLHNNGECIYCRILREEIADGRRLVAQNANFTAFVPFFARWPSEMQIYPRRHFAGIADMTNEEATDLASLIKIVRMKYDRLYGFPMPLMMLLRQAPTQGAHPYFHFHVEFYPIQRSATKLKFLAGIESGAGTFLNDTIAEQQAKILRETPPLL